MKLGIFTVVFGGKKLEKVLEYVKSHGCDMIEIATGNMPGDEHCPIDELLGEHDALVKYKKMISDAGLEISAFSCHGNPLHPIKEVREKHHDVFLKTVELAERMEVGRVVNFSGCPGDSEHAKFPNWVIAAWPDEHFELLRWQWKEKVIPYWEKAVKFANQHSIKKICIEMHPSFVVYNPYTLLKLREAVGDTIGANFDPSHLFWQGIDPLKAVKKLGKTIYHVHAKDTAINNKNTELNGVLDTRPYTKHEDRSWIFRTVGYGHDISFWKDFVSVLQSVGYDDVLSIEHEDQLMGVNEGFEAAAKNLNKALGK
ncbi:MAG: sugar phosphate isomerase/epimerase [bacterium]